MQALERRLRGDPKIDKAEGSSQATVLQGTDVSTLFMFLYEEWRKELGRDHRGPAARVANEFMRIFREHNKLVLEQSELTPALASLTPDRRVRQKTWNWKPAHWNEDGSSEHFNMRSEVEHYFMQHEGKPTSGKRNLSNGCRWSRVTTVSGAAMVSQRRLKGWPTQIRVKMTWAEHTMELPLALRMRIALESSTNRKACLGHNAAL